MFKKLIPLTMLVLMTACANSVPPVEQAPCECCKKQCECTDCKCKKEGMTDKQCPICLKKAKAAKAAK